MPEEKSIELCRTCGSALSGAVALCTRCGQALPDNAEKPRYLVIRPGSSFRSMRREAVRLLGAPDNTEETERQIHDLPALFRAPLPDIMIERLAERLRQCGFRIDVLPDFPPGVGFSEYLESLFSRKTRLLPYLGLAGLTIGLLAAGWAWTPAALLGATVYYAARDHARFLKRLTLRATNLAGRVDMVPEDVLGRFGAFLRDTTLSEQLRGPLGALLDEYGRVLDTLSPFSIRYPDVVRPTRQALVRMARYAALLAEKAATIEKAGDFDDPDLNERLAALRSLRSSEIAQRAQQLAAAREERLGRLEWLREVYGTLLIRLEAVVDTLRSVRQRVLESYVRAEADQRTLETDELATALGRELSVVAETVDEMERLERRDLDLAI